MGFSENLQILRKMKNMSQEQLAERLDEVTLRQLTRNTRLPIPFSCSPMTSNH